MSGGEKLDGVTFGSVGEMMAAYAEEAVRIAWSDHRRILDFGAGSIGVLESILDGQAAEDLERQTRLWGGYFGETLRRRHGGEWVLSQYPGNLAAIPALEIHGSRVFPLMKVYRRLTMGAGESLPAFDRMVAERLQKIGASGDPESAAEHSG